MKNEEWKMSYNKLCYRKKVARINELKKILFLNSVNLAKLFFRRYQSLSNACKFYKQTLDWLGDSKKFSNAWFEEANKERCIKAICNNHVRLHKKLI